MTTQLWIGGTEIWESEDQVLSVVRQKCNVAAQSVWFSRNADSGQLDGYGFVQFDNASDAAIVMRLLKDTPIPHAPTHRIRLNWGKSRGEGDSEAVQQATGFQVYVGNLPVTVTDDKLLQYFRRYLPQAISARLIHGPDGLSRGFGFVRFSTFREVTEAIRTLNGTAEFGRAIKVSEAAQNRIQGPDQGADSSSTTLFLRDIDPEIVKEETLLHHFRPYGNVLRVRIVPGHPDWANVTMETHVEAECAKIALQGSRFGGTTKCNIQFGRAIEEPPVSRAAKVIVPVIGPKRAINKKAQAAFFDDAGVERVLAVIQRTAELRRDAPLAWGKLDVANRREARRRLEEDAIFGWNQASDTVPSSTCFWFYEGLA